MRASAVFDEFLTDFGLIRYLLKGEFLVCVIDPDDAVSPSGTIVESDAMLVGAYVMFLNLGAGFERRQGDAVSSVRTEVGYLCQSIGRNIRLHGSGGKRCSAD